MFINPSLDVDMPHCEDGEMGNVNKNYFLEVERGWKNPYVINPCDYETLPELLNAYQIWWIRTRHMPSTAKKHVNTIRRMACHPIYPVNPWDLNSQQIISYLEYREHNEGVGPYGVRNDWKALKSLARSYGKTIDDFGYMPPSPPPAKIRVIPLPNQVKQQINHKYTKDKTVNKTIQYILAHGYFFGYRPEEFPIQRVDNVKLSDGYMIIIEAKKHYQLRQLFPERELFCGDKHKSVKNLLKLHDRINPGSPYLYIQPNGSPWTVDYLRKWLCSYVKPVFPEFSMYVMRHWCATARLIKSFEATGVWDKEDVKDWLGHDDLRTTDDYTKYAKKYYSLAPFDWIGAVLRTKDVGQNNSLDHPKQKTLNTILRGTGGTKYGPTGILTGFLLLESSLKPAVQFLFFFFSFDVEVCGFAS